MATAETLRYDTCYAKKDAIAYGLRKAGYISNHMIIQNATSNTIDYYSHYLYSGHVKVAPDGRIPQQSEDEVIFSRTGILAGCSGILTYCLDKSIFLHILWDLPNNVDRYGNFIGLFISRDGNTKPNRDLFDKMYQDKSDPGITPQQLSPYDIVSCGPTERRYSPYGRRNWGFRRPCEVKYENFYVAMTMGDNSMTTSTVTIMRDNASFRSTTMPRLNVLAITDREIEDPLSIVYGKSQGRQNATAAGLRSGFAVSNHMKIQNGTRDAVHLIEYYIHWGKARVVPEAILPRQTEDEALFTTFGGWLDKGSSGIITYQLSELIFLHILWNCPYDTKEMCNSVGLYLCDERQNKPSKELFNRMYQDIPNPKIVPQHMSNYDLVCWGQVQNTHYPSRNNAWGVNRKCEVKHGNFQVSMIIGEQKKTSSVVTVLNV